jgi:hypothetical protein
MEELILSVPGLWADHHVLAVRSLLREAPGIEAVTASALDASVCVTYDQSKTDPAKITALLKGAGYDSGEAPTAAQVPTNKPEWATAGSRVTTTDAADLAMSGDHRKY